VGRSPRRLSPTSFRRGRRLWTTCWSASALSSTVEAAFKAKDFVVAKVKARLEKVAAKEPEFAHLLAEVAEHVLSSFGRLMASPDAARHVHEALFYHFEGYQTRDGELLFARIERTVREAVRRAEEAGIPDAEYRIKQFILEIIDILARAGERYRRDALKAVSTVEKALRATAFAGLLRRGAVLRVPRAVFRGRGFVGGLSCGACGGGPLQRRPLNTCRKPPRPSTRRLEKCLSG
jgi:hypothetical protein